MKNESMYNAGTALAIAGAIGVMASSAIDGGFSTVAAFVFSASMLTSAFIAWLRREEYYSELLLGAIMLIMSIGMVVSETSWQLWFGTVLFLNLWTLIYREANGVEGARNLALFFAGLLIPAAIAFVWAEHLLIPILTVATALNLALTSLLEER
jgi:hypothetical protein